VVFGVFMIAAPGVGAVAMVLWIGAYALVYGAILVFLGLRLRGRRRAVRGDAVRRAA
jgi:uncharacterized membrane protein HdeD (DUF308 family)